MKTKEVLSSFSTLATLLFLSLRGAIATKQSLGEVPQSNYSRLQLRNEIATPRQVGARNDTEGHYPMLQTYKVSPIYLN